MKKPASKAGVRKRPSAVGIKSSSTINQQVKAAKKTFKAIAAATKDVEAAKTKWEKSRAVTINACNAAAAASKDAEALIGKLLTMARSASCILHQDGVALPAAVIVVPGGGLTSEGEPAPWVHRRLHQAAAMYKERLQAGETCFIVTLSVGTPHKPMPISPKSGFQVMEAEAGASCLIREHQIAPEHVFEENWSLDTIGNAYMLRAMHTDVASWRKLIILNNEFHMMRTKAIFEKVFSLVPLPPFGEYELDFVEIPNDGLEGEVLASRKEREAKSTASFQANSAEVMTMQQMHTFLFVNHMAYASKRLLKERDPVDVNLLQSY